MVRLAYAVGRLRAIEARLLDHSQIERMADAPNFEAAFIILSETGYEEKVDKLEHAFDFETLLQKEIEETRALLMGLAPGNEILLALFNKFEPGIKDEDQLEALKTAAKEQPLPLFVKYVEGYILLNRVKLELLNGSADPDKLIERYRYRDFGRAVVKGLEEYKKHSSLHVLEREIDDYLMTVVRRAKYQVFGLEPLIGHFIAKETEIKTLRLVLIGKLMQIKPEDLKERLRLSYV
jgi:vacuolar-type H+-ATPase subunit C/Vma6